MPNIGPMEIALVLIIALVILGPKKLPDVGRSVGKGMREFKSAVTGEHKEDEQPAIAQARADEEHEAAPAKAATPAGA